MYERAKSGNCRSLFTLAHELFHAILHGDELAARGGSYVLRDSVVGQEYTLPPGVRVYESPEWQANVGAAAFLMPEQGVRKFLATMKAAEMEAGIEAIAERFEVSNRAAEKRLKRLLPQLA